MLSFIARAMPCGGACWSCRRTAEASPHCRYVPALAVLMQLSSKVRGLEIPYSLAVRSRSALAITDTLLSAIAAPANIGFRSQPNTG